jgi:hypothetical protein
MRRFSSLDPAWKASDVFITELFYLPAAIHWPPMLRSVNSMYFPLIQSHDRNRNLVLRGLSQLRHFLYSRYHL